MVFLPSPENDHVMAEPEGHGGNQFPDKASNILTSVCPKVIEAMIKGLRPGPTVQYFARKPP
jgi:hypothetical protein